MSWGSELRGQRGKGLRKGLQVPEPHANPTARLWGKMGHSPCWAGCRIHSPNRRGAGSITPNSQATGPGQQRRSHPQPPTANMDVPFIHNLVSTCGEGSFKPHPCSGTPHGPEKRQSSDSLSNRGTPKDTVSTSRARHKGLHDRKCPELGSGFMGARDWKAPVGS